MTISRAGVRKRAVLVAVSALVLASSAAAWDSKPEPGTRMLPATRWSAQLPSTPHNERIFEMHSLKDTIGGWSTRPQDRFVRAIVCPEDVLTPSSVPTRHCRLAETDDTYAMQAGWLAVRSAGEVAHESEHTLLALEAARRAGLIHVGGPKGTGPYILEPFWVRYPARDALIGSRIPPAKTSVPPESLPPDPPVELLFAQSLLPVPFTDPNASFAARSVSLLELAQLPDFSHSLADWAAGNEACPVSGVDSAYQGIHSIEACHQFKMAMGAVNVTHFAPLNRDMWRYYHNLALSRMAECRSYAPLLPKFYADPGSMIPASETEVNECERLAMAYEMFAQHFLQDAWSIGHMWEAWGAPSLDDYPSEVQLFQNEAPPPAIDIPGRRALIGALVGAVRGMVHGTKGLTVNFVRESAGSILASVLDQLGAFEDPLNGGRYTALPVNGNDTGHPALVRWGDANSAVRFPGAGDLYWDPLVAGNVVVSMDPNYAVQRERFLNCSARSMLDVYSAGPHAHGQVDAYRPELDQVAVEDDACWNHWAENAAMLAALNASDNRYLNALLSLGGFLRVANQLTLSAVAPTVRLTSNPLNTQFVNRVQVRLGNDLRNILQAYMDNAREYPTGFHSAHQNGYDDSASVEQMALLGVRPMRPSTTSSLPQGVEYLDGVPSATAVLDEALSRMFWRGDLRHTCGLTGIDQLKQRCVGGAVSGGDAEACTACVAAAELHAPPCGISALLDSKCSAIGAENNGSGVPSWWFDARARFAPDLLPQPFGTSDKPYCEAPEVLALEWCTDTPQTTSNRRSEGNLLTRAIGPYHEIASHRCPGDESFGYGPYTWGVREYRGARFLQETPPIVASAGGAPPWIYPMAVAYDYSVTTRPGEDPCDLLDEKTTSRDLVIADTIAPAALSEYYSAQGPGGEIPRCGISQREFTISTNCGDAIGALGVHLPPEVRIGTFQWATGAALVEDPTSLGSLKCWLREPRRYQPSCPSGFSCTAGGECVAGARLPTAIVSLDPATPTP